MLFHRFKFKNQSPRLIGLVYAIAVVLLPALTCRSAMGQLPIPGTAARQPQPSAPTPPPTTPSVAAKPEPIPLGDVAKRLEASRRLLKEISERAEATELAGIAKEVEGTRSAF